MQQIGVRALRQEASRYLKRVQAGEAFEVTENGRPAARLVPVSPDPWQALIDSGQVIRSAHEEDDLLLLEKVEAVILLKLGRHHPARPEVEPARDQRVTRATDFALLMTARGGADCAYRFRRSG